ncbi:efflux RND transporter permease subunit [Cupriavidus sp. D39]|uniref:efflux RND transporter permease subunit n=1 Tax=Cupriavidus sp. D39 TaxID=2997877 RepID=UPI00226EC16C|nr:efflux RND transporter permease subunit [Cupriavidus sp. D39]MCY0855124.1 efflux RND transporter permease subunit [Cupriavidus sp. D39]
MIAATDFSGDKPRLVSQRGLAVHTIAAIVMSARNPAANHPSAAGPADALGYAALDVMEAIRTAYQSAEVAQVYEANAVVNVAVVLASESRRTPAQVGELPLRNADGVMVPLSRLADITQTTGRYLILHDGGQRLQTVTAHLNGPSLGQFVSEAQRRKLPLK